jgi:hypothetical protein
LIFAGIAAWAAFVWFGMRLEGEEPVVNAFGIIYGILLVVAIVVFLDWWSGRTERQSRDRAA